MHVLNRKSCSDRKCKEGMENLLPLSSYNDMLIESALKLMKNFNLSINLQ